MSKKITYIVKDNTTIELSENGSKGDIIDLRDNIKIDTSFLSNAIRAEYENQKKIDIQNELDKQKEQFEDTKKEIIKRVSSDEEAKYAKKITEKDAEITRLNEKISSFNEQANKEKTIAVDKAKNDLQSEHNKTIGELYNTIKQLNNQILQLERMQSNKNVKKIGEDLEQWCLAEFRKYQNCGAFKNALFEKDNTIIDRTKADFIFKVFDDKNKELVSVCLEMKSETGHSSTPQKNDKFFDKLNKDRLNKKCEYAILVSELEPENNFIWYEVSNYKKMYVIRPVYLFQLLSLLYNLNKKYEEANKLIEQKLNDASSLGEKNEILEKFAAFKKVIIEQRIRELFDSTDDITKSAGMIKNHADKIINKCNVTITKTINRITSEFTNFDLNSNVNNLVNKKAGDANYSPAFFKKNKN